MSRRILYQIAAVVLVVGAVLTAAGNLLAPQGGARAAIASGSYDPIAVAVLLGGLLVMASLPAVYLRQRAESGVLGFAGMVAILAAGLPLTVGFPLIQVLIYPWIATMTISNKVLNEGPTSFIFFFAVASAVVSLGGVLFGVATIRARIFSRQVGIGLIVLAAASFVLGFLSLPGGGGIRLSWWWGTTGTFGVVAYMVALAWYGIELFRSVGAAPWYADHVRWITGTAAQFKGLHTDLITMTGNVAQVFVADQEWRTTLRACRDALRPDGQLVFV